MWYDYMYIDIFMVIDNLATDHHSLSMVVIVDVIDIRYAGWPYKHDRVWCSGQLHSWSCLQITQWKREYILVCLFITKPSKFFFLCKNCIISKKWQYDNGNSNVNFPKAQRFSSALCRRSQSRSWYTKSARHSDFIWWFIPINKWNKFFCFSTMHRA